MLFLFADASKWALRDLVSRYFIALIVTITIPVIHNKIIQRFRFEGVFHF